MTEIIKLNFDFVTIYDFTVFALKMAKEKRKERK
jgi:hypothetical protein